jgi:UDP-glucose 4,6-dehydratase
MVYTQDNVVGIHSLLEAVRLHGQVRRFIHINTDEAYGENSAEEGSKTEHSILMPTNPYAASKAGAEMLVNLYVCLYRIPAIVMRSNNVYGIGQYP